MQAEQTGLAEMLQMLVKDRRRRDEELAEERRRHDEEVRLLRQMVEETLGRRVQPSVVPGGDGNGKVKLTKLGATDDVEAYLTTFERMMVVYEVPKERWAFMLAPQLTGKAQQAFAAMDMALSADYDEVKAAILRRYGINEEAYRQRFQSAERKEDETHRELAIRLGDTARKWTKRCETLEGLMETLVVEQVVETLQPEIRVVWVRERKPQTGVEAGQLVDECLEARSASKQADVPPVGQATAAPHNGSADVKKYPNSVVANAKKCFGCGGVGHVRNDCP